MFAILRSRRYYAVPDLVTQFKAHVLPVLEAVTGMVYHAAKTTTAHLDQVLSRFLSELGLPPSERVYNLLPQACVDEPTVNKVLRVLTQDAKHACEQDRHNWQSIYSPHSVYFFL